MTRSNILSVNVLQDTDVNRFRLECLSNNSVTCPLSTMHNNWLVNHKLSEIWWDLSDKERSSVSKYIIDNYLFFKIPYYRHGYSDCKGSEEEYKEAKCVINSRIRYFLMGNGEKYYDQVSMCYWSINRREDYCFVGESFNLPICTVSVISTEPVEGNIYYGHNICSFQIKSDKTKFDSWRFFQYSDDNITPCSNQMPCTYYNKDITLKVRVYEYTDSTIISQCGAVLYNMDLVASWLVNKDGVFDNMSSESLSLSDYMLHTDNLFMKKIEQLYNIPDLHIDSIETIKNTNEVLLYVTEITNKNMTLNGSFIDNYVIKVIKLK